MFYKKFSEPHNIEYINITVLIYIGVGAVCQLACTENILLEHYQICGIHSTVAIHIALYGENNFFGNSRLKNEFLSIRSREAVHIKTCFFR